MKNILRLILNLFFRGNNLLWVLIKAKFRRHNIQIGTSSNLVNCRFYISGGGNTIHVGDHCGLSGLYIYMNCSGCSVYIGDGVRVSASEDSPTCFYACDGGSIVINDNSLFSNRVEILTTDFHEIFNEQGVRYNHSSNVVIGENCWIGMQALILKGVNLSNDTVVGARSVVTKSCKESNVVMCGFPAKVIRKGIEWNP